MLEYKNLKNKSGIYCFKNMINGKYYIGQAVNLKNRLKSHFNSIKRGTNLQLPFYKAVAKYGIENFDLSILEYVDPNIPNIKEVLDELEIKYISEYNSYGENGYNMTKGGDADVLDLKMTSEQKEKISNGAKIAGEKRKKRVCMHDMYTNKWYVDITYEEIYKITGIHRSSVSRVCNGHNGHPWIKNYTFANTEKELFENWNYILRHWDRFNNNSGRFKPGHKNGGALRTIYEIDAEGNIINTFKGLKNLAQILGVTVNKLSRCINKSEITPILGRMFKYTKPYASRKAIHP